MVMTTGTAMAVTEWEDLALPLCHRRLRVVAHGRNDEIQLCPIAPFPLAQRECIEAGRCLGPGEPK